jgi:hypothetical protein
MNFEPLPMTRVNTMRLFVLSLVFLAPLAHVESTPEEKSSKGNHEDLTAEERELLQEYLEGKWPGPRDLLKAYMGFVRGSKTATESKVAGYCLPQSVRITREPRRKKPIGEGISLPFLQSSFRPWLVALNKENDNCFLIATGTSGLFYVKTKHCGWKLYRYVDSPAE